MFKVGGKSKSVRCGRGTGPKLRGTPEESNEQGICFESCNCVCRNRCKCGDACRGSSTRESDGLRAAAACQLGYGAQTTDRLVAEVRRDSQGVAGGYRDLLAGRGVGSGFGGEHRSRGSESQDSQPIRSDATLIEDRPGRCGGAG